MCARQCPWFLPKGYVHGSKVEEQRNGVAVLDAPATEAQPLLRINFDDLDAIETVVESEPEQAAPSEPEVDTEEQILVDRARRSTRRSLAIRSRTMLALGQAWKRVPTTATEGVLRFVGYGRSRLQHHGVEEHNMTPNSYDRAKIIKKVETVPLCAR